jgi:ATP-binding cassette subfamily A (ABC1) protein 3
LFVCLFFFSSHHDTGVTTVRDMKEDSNVRNERKRVEGGLAGEDTVIIQELRKVHPGGGLEKDHLAVKGLSLGIPPGECFGFL